ncbi:hypothetical protein [Streptomyces sp. NPDC001315]|uniref:hypothetical protein n=1 Tax=Streptomyces sp. NPDC001315 TaxID=3364562 RepID=UPI003675DD5D
MDKEAIEDARRWLAEHGVTRLDDGAWAADDAPGERLTSNEVAHGWAGLALTDGDRDATGRLRLAFGLLDLLDDYWVTCEIRFADRGPEGPLPAEPLWESYRRRLEAPRDAEAVTYSLWVDWFEDRDTAAVAFAEVLGRDIGLLRSDAPQALLRRTRRVLECSGPVPWPAKDAAYRAAARLPVLHPALFKALLNGYHDVHGDLEPTGALSLLADLDLPTGTEHVGELHAVLAAGHRNHYRSPGAWDEAVRRNAG